VLYLILSKTELSLASPDLTMKIASTGGSIDGDCTPRGPEGSRRQDPPWTPSDLRSDSAIEIVRYELEHQESTESR